MSDQNDPNPGDTPDQSTNGGKPAKARGGPRNRRPVSFLFSVLDENGKPVAGANLQLKKIIATRDQQEFFRTFKGYYGKPSFVQYDYTQEADEPAVTA